MEFKAGLKGGFYGIDGNCFKIGRTVFEAMENEDDGYRSMLDEVEEVNVRDLKGLNFFRRPVDSIEVVAASEFGEDRRQFDGYEVRSTRDGHVWLLIGTDCSDDCYPRFTFRYTPRSPERKTL